MRSILLIALTTIITISISAQTVPPCLKKPDGELKVLFTSVYKIVPTYYGAGAENDLSKPSWKETGDLKGTKHVTDKSMTDDNGLLLQEWYKLLKERLEKMGVPVPENFDYLNMQDPAEGAVEAQKKLTDVKQWVMITCNDLSKAQKAFKKGTLSLESFNNVVISIQCAGSTTSYIKRGSNLASILDKVEEDL
ncbi:MAG: hypothetical protein H6587_02185 [Flavobacteriales bacterium]|nr:hypothetical protein [Flavobacteriales bacterium]MCB9363354.1 hypothetical protein [Flavobacteriales bacterium]